MTAYKVRNEDGQFAGPAFHYWTKKGKTWSTRSALNCAFGFWLGDVRRDNRNNARLGRPQLPETLPEEWTVIELTPDGVKEYPAQAFYEEKRR